MSISSSPVKLHEEIVEEVQKLEEKNFEGQKNKKEESMNRASGGDKNEEGDVANETDDDVTGDDDDECENIKKGFQKDKKKKKNSSKHKTKKRYHHAARGGAIGAMRNALRYSVKAGKNAGRRTNLVNFFDKAARSSRGNPRWWCRFDMPHGKVDYHHINLNPKITGVKDPHIRISPTTAKIAGTAGKVLEYANKAAPVIMAASIAYEVYQVSKSVSEDLKNGSSRNTTEKIVETAATTGGGVAGWSAGATIGTMILPGIGTLFGGLIGSILGGIAAGSASEKATGKVLDAFGHDIDHPTCKKCGREFERRTYLEGKVELCQKCR